MDSDKRLKGGPNTVLRVTDQTLAELGITTREIIAAIEHTLTQAAEQRVAVAPKTGVFTPDGRYLMATLSASDDSGILAVKAIVANERNKQRGLPGVNGAFLLLDSESGQLKGVLDANWITAVRTAGLSLLAATRLADPESRTLGLIGAGVQAESHLRAFADWFPLQNVVVVGRGNRGLERMQTVALELGLKFVQSNIETCLTQSDIVVSAVSRDHSNRPFLDARMLPPGTFVSSADLGIPWNPAYLSVFDVVYVDDLNQERVMDKPMVPMKFVTGDLFNLIADEIHLDPEKPTFFVFRGIAAGDLALAELVYRRIRGSSD